MTWSRGIRRRALAQLFIGGLLLGSATAYAGEDGEDALARAAQISCQDALKEGWVPPSRNAVRVLQLFLELTTVQDRTCSTYPDALADGVLGGVSRCLLEPLCNAYKKARAKSDVKALDAIQYARLMVAYPYWQQTLESKDFQDWAEQQAKAFIKKEEAGPGAWAKKQLGEKGVVEILNVLADYDEYDAQFYYVLPSADEAGSDDDAGRPDAGDQHADAAAETRSSDAAQPDAKAPSPGNPAGAQEEPTLDDVDPDHLDMLSPLTGVPFPSGRLFEAALRSILCAKKTLEQCKNARKGTPIFESVRDLVSISRRPRRPPDVQPPAIESDGCGCSQDFLGVPGRERETVAYGFVPAWAGTVAEPWLLDFSILSRISYPAPVSSMQRSKAGRAIATAHRYDTGVDLIFQVTGLREWTSDEIGEQAKGIAETFTALRRGGGLFSRQPDGVTLAFAAYTPSYRVNLRRFVAAVRAELGETVPIHLMLPFASATFWIQELGDLILDEVSLVLVPLERPTTSARKELFRRIDAQLHGSERATALDRIIPVIPPTGYRGGERRKLVHDLVYFEDRFAGAGFWPVPRNPGPDGDPTDLEGLKSALLSTFASHAAEDAWSSATATLRQAVCRVVCPNRAWVRLAGGGILAALVLIAILTTSSCRVRHFFEERRWAWLPLAGAPLIAILPLGYCDPAWNRALSAMVGTAYLFLLGRLLFQSFFDYDQPRG